MIIWSASAYLSHIHFMRINLELLRRGGYFVFSEILSKRPRDLPQIYLAAVRDTVRDTVLQHTHSARRVPVPVIGRFEARRAILTVRSTAATRGRPHDAVPADDVPAAGRGGRGRGLVVHCPCRDGLRRRRDPVPPPGRLHEHLERDDAGSVLARPSRANSAPRSLRRALLTPQVNPGSFCRCG